MKILIILFYVSLDTKPRHRYQYALWPSESMTDTATLNHGEYGVVTVVVMYGDLERGMGTRDSVGAKVKGWWWLCAWASMQVENNANGMKAGVMGGGNGWYVGWMMTGFEDGLGYVGGEELLSAWFKVAVSVIDSEDPEAYRSRCIGLVSDDT